jgi:hypothetical protein
LRRTRRVADEAKLLVKTQLISTIASNRCTAARRLTFVV